MKIFFSGIGGSGVSAIAAFMAEKGHTVSGSDRAFDQAPSHPVREAMMRMGIAIAPQDGSGLDKSFDVAVFSTAVEHDRPEVLRAKELGVPMKTRPEYLAELVESHETVAVTGTSGKSTTSGMLAFLMKRLGLEPNFLGGGRVKQFMTGPGTGNCLAGGSRLLVVEACESDGSIVNYRPCHAVMLNLALDHHAIEKTAEMFRALIMNTSGLVVTNADDENLSRLGLQGAATYSTGRPAKYAAEEIVEWPLGCEFSFAGTRFALSLPGRHNVSNAMACIALLSEMGIPPEDIALHLREFRGIQRRFDVLIRGGAGFVADDYAHNPHKIAALMKTARGLSEGICYIFQPHGFAPVRLMKDDYIEVFSEHLRASDHLLILPIYYSGGTVSRDVSSETLAEGVRARGRKAESVSGRGAVLGRLQEWDSYVVFGARDETLSGFAGEIAARKNAATAAV